MDARAALLKGIFPYVLQGEFLLGFPIMDLALIGMEFVIGIRYTQNQLLWM